MFDPAIKQWLSLNCLVSLMYSNVQLQNELKLNMKEVCQSKIKCFKILSTKSY